MKTPVPPSNPFEVSSRSLESSLKELAAIGSTVLKRIAAEASKNMPHKDRADLIRLEIAVADLLFALRPKP